MTAPIRVSERDLHTLLGIVAGDRDDLPAAGLPDSLLSDLTSAVRCDIVTFSGLDSGRKTHWFGQDVPAKDISGGVQGFWAHYWHCPFSCYPDRSGDLRSVTKISDWYSARQWHSTAIYCDYFRGQEFEHQLALCLPATPGSSGGPGRTIRLAFFRGPGRDFSERDRALLALLRLVAAGRTNAQIARARPVGRNRAHPPAEHLRRAAGTQPHCRGYPRVHRPHWHVMADTAAGLRPKRERLIDKGE